MNRCDNEIRATSLDGERVNVFRCDKERGHAGPHGRERDGIEWGRFGYPVEQPRGNK